MRAITMDVTIDTVTAKLQRAADTAPETRSAPRREGVSESEKPELSFATRAERLRARLRTF